MRVTAWLPDWEVSRSDASECDRRGHRAGRASVDCVPRIRAATSAHHRRPRDRRHRPAARSRPASTTSSDAKFPLSGLSGNLLQRAEHGRQHRPQLDRRAADRWRAVSAAEHHRTSAGAAFADAGFRAATRPRRSETSIIGTKVRMLARGAGRPSLGFRFATRLPNASNESGLGRDTTDFTATFLIGKTIQSVRVVGNVGFLILEDPLMAAEQDDLLIYGLSLARAVTAGLRGRRRVDRPRATSRETVSTRRRRPRVRPRRRPLHQRSGSRGRRRSCSA